MKGYKKDKTVKRINFNWQKKNLYENEDDRSSYGSDSETKEILFMAQKNENVVLEKKPRI